MIEGYIRVDKAGNDSSKGLDFLLVFGTNFHVHGVRRGEAFEIIDEDDILARIKETHGIRPNAYFFEWDDKKEARVAQLYSLNESEYRKAVKIQDDYFLEVLLGK